ncbi:MAG TPA: DUF1028 domain-containing protein [Myxococcota bacterium]|nr:DUF1028 domain-containing protein [Myxococcota bacterium]
MLTAAAVAAAGPARATWSIVAVDSETREVGIAGASCIAGAAVIAGVVPGHGVIAAQAFTNRDGRDTGMDRLAQGASPQAIVGEIASADFDWLGFLPLHRLRQYGVVSLDFLDAPAAYTGAWSLDWHGDAHARGVSVQGNTLYGPEVVRDALAAYEASAPRCPLVDRLQLALEAGAARGGDRRCSREQAALSAFLIVAKPRDHVSAPWLRLAAPDQDKGQANPVAVLRGILEAWRARQADATPRCAPGP